MLFFLVSDVERAPAEPAFDKEGHNTVTHGVVARSEKTARSELFTNRIALRRRMPLG
jgi:hypothetical protein